MKYWEIVADRLRKVGWSLGRVSALGVEGRTICIVDGHRDDANRFFVRADFSEACVREFPLPFDPVTILLPHCA